MAYPAGAVQVTGPIGTTNSADTYHTHYDFLGQGGLMTIDTVANRNLIPSSRRKFGMLVSVYADGTAANNKMYILANTALGGTNNTITDNTNWIAFSTVIGGGHVIQYQSVSLTQRLTLNVLNGLIAADDAGSSKTTLSAGGTLIDNITYDGVGTYSINMNGLNALSVTGTDATFNMSGDVNITGQEVIFSSGGTSMVVRGTEVQMYRPLQIHEVASLPAAVNAQILYDTTNEDFYAAVDTRWVSVTRPEIVDTSATFITLNELHRNKIIRCTATTAIQVTLPSLSRGFQVMIVKASTGDITFVTAGTLDAIDTQIVVEDGAATVVSRGSNEWMAFGALGVGGGVTLTDGNATTVNGTSIDLGGLMTADITIDADNRQFSITNVDVFSVGIPGNALFFVSNSGSLPIVSTYAPLQLAPTETLNLPDPTLYPGTILYDTDTQTVKFSDGVAWANVGGGGGGISDGNKGDITVSGGGATWTINDDAVTFAKFQNSAPAGLSVIGRNTNSAGNFAEITAGNDFEVLRRSGTSIGFGTVTTNGIANQAVTRAKISNGLELSVIGRASNSIGVTADIQATANSNAILRESGAGTIGWGSINLASTGAVGTSILALANGGTGASSFGANQIIYSTGTVLASEAGFEYNPATNNFTAPFINAGSSSINGGITIYGENYAGTNSNTDQLILRKGTTGTPAVGIGSSIVIMVEDSAAINTALNLTVSLEDVTNATKDTLITLSGYRDGSSVTVISGSGNNDRLDTALSTFRIGAGSSAGGTLRSILAEGNGSNIDLTLSSKGTGNININAGPSSDGLIFMKADGVGFLSNAYGGGRIALLPRSGGFVAAGTATNLWTEVLAAGTNSLSLYTERGTIADAAMVSTHSFRVTINGNEFDIMLKAV